jgi:hypothetical protein
VALERTGMDLELFSNSILSAGIPSCRMLKRSPQDEVGGEEKRPRREEPVTASVVRQKSLWITSSQ